MNVLIIKLGATGDVVRTTPLLQRLDAHVTWITAAKNVLLIESPTEELRCLSWEQREVARDRGYDLVINLEDTLDVGQFVNSISKKQVFGAYLDSDGGLSYTDDSRHWFDLSLISRFGRDQADQRKLENRRSYQELLFEGLGFGFAGETYVLPESPVTNLIGDVAIAAESGSVWPMKQWAHYDQLQRELEADGLRVNRLPPRPTLLEHLSDVRNHRCQVGGDSLPMHLALGSGIRCVTLFNCTSPWEIHDYGLQTKLVSPLLNEFFYKRHFDLRATTAIPFEKVLNAVREQLQVTA